MLLYIAVNLCTIIYTILLSSLCILILGSTHTQSKERRVREMAVNIYYGFDCDTEILASAIISVLHMNPCVKLCKGCFNLNVVI